MARTRQCPECDAPVRLNKRYCPECHSVVNPKAPEDPIVKVREDAEFKSILMLGLSAMALFFSFGFFLPAVLAEPGFLVVSVVLFVIGIALIIASRVVKHRMRKQIARLTDELHVKCDYCGGVNDRDQHRCAFCGAPIVTLPHKGSSAGPTFR